MINADLLSIDNTLGLGIANHLWQSTLFAAAAWLITIFLKKNRARVRYWIWFSVSIKFLVPFSLIVSLGSLITPKWSKAPVEISPKWNIIQTINQPFNPPELEVVSPTLDTIDSPSPSDKIPFIIFSLWICGSFAVLLNCHKRGMRVSRMVRKAEPLIDDHTVKDFHRIKQENRISNTVQLAATHDSMEPGVFGVFRPVLLLPAGILKHVNDSELETILLHEIEHIRCKDNLIAFIHMFVEALFWFHPVVWWTGSRLVFERELACDESVLQAGRNPKVYAQGILKVCEYYFKSPMAYVSGVIGSNLKIRMEGIMKNQIGHKLSLGKKLFLSMAGLLILCIPLVLGIINAPPSQANSFNNDLNKFYVNEYQPDIFQISDKSERENNPSEIINKEQEQGNSRVISNAGTMFQSEYSGTDKNPAEKSGYFKAVRESVLSTDAEDSIVLTQKEATVKVFTDAGNVPKTRSVNLEIEDADTYISQGVSHLKEGQIEGAITDFNKAINIDPGKAVAYVARGSAYFRLNRPDNAISDYNKAIEINPNLAVAYQNRGSVYYSQGKFDNAISDYNKAIEINPDFGAAYQDRGNIYQSQGRFDNAISDFSKALELNPRDALIHYFRGNAYYKQGRPDDAISDYNKAVDIYPRFAVAYQNRGSAYYSKGDYKKAISDYDKSIGLNPENFVTYSSRGNAYFKQGQIDEAISDYNKALELNPDIGKTNDGQEIVCRRIAPTGSIIKNKICLTNAQWAVKEMGQGLPNNKNWTYENYLYIIKVYE